MNEIAATILSLVLIDWSVRLLCDAVKSLGSEKR